MKLFRSFAAIAAFASLAGAATVVGNVGNDAAFNTYMTNLGVPGVGSGDYSYEVFAPQGRIGNNSLSNAEYEIGLHVNNTPYNTPPTDDSPLAAASGSRELVWGSAGFTNTLFDFELKRVGITISFKLTSAGTTLYSAQFDDPRNAYVTLFDFRTRAQSNTNTTSSQALLSNLTLIDAYSTVNIPDSAAWATGGVSATQNVVVKDIVGDLILTGKTALDWNGTKPGSSALAWQIKAFYGVPDGGSGVPEPGSMMLMGGSLTGLFAYLIRRRQIR